MTETYVLLSGGPDSTSLAYVVAAESKDFECIYIDYGHPAKKKEASVARRVAKKLGVNLVVLKMGGLYQSFQENGLSPEAMRMAGCGDPYAQVLVAATFAAAKGAKRLLMGVHKDDLITFPETEKVLRAQNKVVNAVTSVKGFSDFEYEFPFIKKTKAEVMAIGSKAGAPLHLTWSCYEAITGKEHCGKCNGCKKRKAAFSLAKLQDMTGYLK